jgi:FkbM family methyltransferase
MNPSVKALAKRILARSPYRLSRGAPNRFDANESCLRHLARCSFAPKLVIDVGANVGAFAVMARKVFPAAAIHMIEPQPGCAPPLQALLGDAGFFYHPVAATSKAGPVQMLTSYAGDTGAHIAWQEGRHLANLTVQGKTLDELFASNCDHSDRVLLKLDVQGHELVALSGASALLPKVEVVLLEVSFFQQVREPTVLEVVQFFDGAGFDLYDIAALAGRTRDGRLRQGDLAFVKRNSPLWLDKRWE